MNGGEGEGPGVLKGAVRVEGEADGWGGGGTKLAKRRVSLSFRKEADGSSSERLAEGI